MRTIRTKVYKFNELSKETQKSVIENSWDINVMDNWYESTFEDAEQAGLLIEEFNLDTWTIKGRFETSAPECVETILSTHGENCNTYKTALGFKHAFQLPSDELGFDSPEVLEETEDRFLEAVLQDYLQMLRVDYDYQTSEEAIIKTIEANEYEFTSNGKMI